MRSTRAWRLAITLPLTLSRLYVGRRGDEGDTSPAPARGSATKLSLSPALLPPLLPPLDGLGRQAGKKGGSGE